MPVSWPSTPTPVLSPRLPLPLRPRPRVFYLINFLTSIPCVLTNPLLKISPSSLTNPLLENSSQKKGSMLKSFNAGVEDLLRRVWDAPCSIFYHKHVLVGNTKAFASRHRLLERSSVFHVHSLDPQYFPPDRCSPIYCSQD